MIDPLEGFIPEYPKQRDVMKIVVILMFAAALGGCAAVAEKTNMISDNTVKSQTAGALGYVPNDLEIVSRRTEGTNTYVVVKVKDNREFACTLNGGNILTMGMVNPPSCNPRK